MKNAERYFFLMRVIAEALLANARKYKACAGTTDKVIIEHIKGDGSNERNIV